MTRRLFQDSTMMQNTRQVAVRYVAIDAAGFQHFQVVQREKAAIGTHLSWWLATFPVHFVHHRYQQPIVVQFPADLLGHDQMIVAHRQRCGIAQSESPPIRQKAAVPIGAGKLAHPGFLQPLEPHRNVAQLCGKLLHGRARHLQPGPFIGIFAGALLLPAPNVLADLGAFRAQLLEAIGGAGRCAGRDARGINGYVPQLSQSQRARQLHHLGEDVVQRSPMPLAKLIQRPKIRLRPSRQIAKRQIFPNALLQPPRTGHPQRVGIQPHFQQQRRVIRWMSLIAIASFQFPQVQFLHRAMHEKTQMIFSQHRSHRWWQQISLLRVVLQKIGHPALLLSSQYSGCVKPSCHTDSYTLTVSAAGFKDAVSSVTIGAKRLSPLRIPLVLASQLETVTVGGDDSSPQVTTDPAQNQSANTFERAALDRVPVFDQDYVTTLSRFLSDDAIATSGVSLVVNGIEANGPGVTPSAVGEVRINQNPYSALFANPGRARLEITTKPGTPDFHGTVNFMARDAVFDAANAFATQKPPESRQYYEGSLTGPLSHDKKTTFLLSLQDDLDNSQNFVDANGLSGPIHENVPDPTHHFFGQGRVFHELANGDLFWVSYSYESTSLKNYGVGGSVLPE